VYGKSLRTKQVNRVVVPPETRVIQDSGAFSDGPGQRLSYESALDRQLAHATRYNYANTMEALASYDLLIDEKWQNGERNKQRWSRAEADLAVRQTVNAAAYLNTQRRRLRLHFGRPMPLVLSAQGVEVEQYLACATRIVPYLQAGDIFGLGGWCITGLQPSAVLPSFREIMQTVIPYLGTQGVKRAHIWGMIYPDALGELAYLCDQAGIHLSTDSSGPCFNPIRPSWGYGSWRDTSYTIPPILASCHVRDASGNKAPICEHGTFCRGLERIRHVELTRDYLVNFAAREPLKYRSEPFVRPTYVQESWFALEGVSCVTGSPSD